MGCPKCGYSGHNKVFHSGTGEVECENCGRDYVRNKKSKKEESESFELPLLGSSLVRGHGFHKSTTPLGEEIMMGNKFLGHLQKETGMDFESLISKKSKPIKGESNFSPLLKLSKDLIGNAKTEKLLTDKFGWDPERAFKEASMPKFDLSYQKSHDIMLGRNIDMSIFF